MPSQVPPGYTRGSIMFIASETFGPRTEPLLQRFWDEAGAYGARIAIVSVGRTDSQRVEQIYRTFVDWESDTVEVLRLDTRHEALDATTRPTIESATGILLVGDDPLAASTILGATPVAQAIRKANARNKVVGALGGCGSILCQHMLVLTTGTPGLAQPTVQFIPGLGLLNRLALDAQAADPGQAPESSPGLVAAVAYNPFLTAVQMAPDTGIAVYPDSTLEVFGSGSANLADGSNITSISLEEGRRTPLANGAKVQVLKPGYTYNFDTQAVARPAENEIPPTADDVSSAF